MTAVGYIRVSTEEQASGGVSLEAQGAKLRAWAELNGAELVAVHVDAGLSGCRADNRPGLRAALDAACREQAALVVYSLSRLARSTRDTLDMAERLDRAGADLVSLSERIDTTTAAGKMVFRMLAVLNEFERDQISERTAMALAHKRSRGEKTGGDLPYGYRLCGDGVTLAPEISEQVVISAAQEYRAAVLSLRQVGERLAAVGYRPRRGGRWHPQTVKNLLSATVAG